MNRPVRPLAVGKYLLRNPRRVWPAVAVQALVTALVLAVVTPLSGFEETAETSIRALHAFTPITPMRKYSFDDSLTRIIEANPALDRHVKAKAFFVKTPMIVGDDYTMLLALDRGEQEGFLARIGNRLFEGALPAAGSDGAVLHVDVARARHMKIGDAFGRLVDPDEPTPGKFTVVGLVKGPARVGLVDLAYASKPDFVLARVEAFEVVYAKEGRKAESDAFLNAAADDDGNRVFKVFDEAYVRSREKKAFENLPLILDFIIGALTVIIGLVVVLLNLIAFQARLDEFGLLLAVGRTRGRLLRKLVSETAVQAVAAWALGLGLGFALLAYYDAVFLAPKAIVIRFVDPYPLALASALPIVAAAASALVLGFRLRHMDPVSVIQRRNA